MERAPAVYEARFGFNRQIIGTLLVSVALSVVAIVARIPPAVAVLSVTLFGVGGLVVLLGSLGGGVALRVDQEGVTLGSPGLAGLRREPVAVPWPMVRRILLFEQALGAGFGGRIPYLGLLLHHGMLAPPGAAGRGWAARAAAWLLPHVPPEAIPLSRGITGFRLDRARLLDAVAANAPDVDVVDVDLDGATYPATRERPRRWLWPWR
jgi:hypothetical protein